MATTELLFKINVDNANFKSTMAQVRSELTQTGRTQTSVGKGELSMRTQLAAASSLQRQRSASLIGEWKRTETAAKQLASGVQPVSANLQRITDTMQALGASSAVLTGPLGGVAGRLRSIGSLATEAGGGLGIMGAAAGALVVGVVAAGVAIFKLTQQAAEFQGKMFDLSQQVGVSVETLSTLEIVAQTSGASIEAITQSIFIFQQKLEDAQDPTSKEAKLLKELGVETNNTEQAFRQALTAIAKMPEGFQQSDTAAQLFGSRGGKQVLGVLKEMGGDLDATTDKFRKMGVLISTDAAKAADKFNDQMAVLGFQIRAAAAIVGNEAMPVILEAVQNLSKVLADNRETLSGWTRGLGDAASGALFLAQHVSGLIPLLERLGNVFPSGGSTLELLFRATPIGGAIGALADLERLRAGPFGGVTGGAGGVAPLARRTSTGGGGRGGKGARDTGLQDATKEAALAERKALLITEADIIENKRAYEEQVRTIEEFTRRAIELDGQQLAAKIDRVTAESNALDEALAKRLIKQDEYENKQRDLDLDAATAHQKNKDDAFKLEQDRDRKIAEVRIAAKKREVDIAEALDAQEIKRIDQRVEDNLLSVSEGERQVAKILDAGFQRRRELLIEESDAYSTSAERRADVTAEIIRQDNARTASAEEAARRIAKAAFDEQNAGAAGATRNRRFAIDKPEITGAVDQLFEAVNTELTGSTQSAALAGLTAMETAFQGVGEAVGQAARAFVLFGSAGTSVRKVTAEILASITQQAAVKAVFEFAEGLAALALAFFGLPNAGPSASAHFAAAAAYAAIAGVAGLTGRAIAGNSFNQTGGAGGTGERTGGPQERRPEIQPRDINRAGAVPPINIFLTGEATESFEYRVEKVAVGSVRGNGVFRKIQNGEDV